MVIVTPQEKKQKKLIYLLIIILIITGLVLIYGFFWERALIGPTVPMEPTVPIGEQEQIEQMRPIEEIREIDFNILESPFLKRLEPFEKIEPFREEIGRENPFVPY